jgi:hypothetical protein
MANVLLCRFHLRQQRHRERSMEELPASKGIINVFDTETYFDQLIGLQINIYITVICH